MARSSILSQLFRQSAGYVIDRISISLFFPSKCILLFGSYWQTGLVTYLKFERRPAKNKARLSVFCSFVFVMMIAKLCILAAHNWENLAKVILDLLQSIKPTNDTWAD